MKLGQLKDYFFQAIKLLAASRKFQVAVLAAVVWGVGKLGLEISTEDLLPLVAPLWAYIFGVALEDLGKGAKASTPSAANKSNAAKNE